MNKWWIIAIVLIIAIVAFLPKIASTPLGKPFFVKALAAKSQSKVEVGSLNFSWLGPQKFQQIKWVHEEATGTLEELDIEAPFWSFSGPFHLKNGSIAYQGGRIEAIEGELQGNAFTLQGTTLQGHIALKGEVYSKLQFHIDVDLKNFPSIVINPRLSSLLGPTFNLNGFVRREEGKGTLQLDVIASYLKTHINGFFTDQAVTLQEPLIATFLPTPPLLSPQIEMQNPVTLRIEPKGVSCPLPFSLENLEIAEATLDLGRVQCQAGKVLAAIESLLKAKRLSKTTCWFTPVQWRIHKGILELGRVDALLASAIHLCAWGKVHLIRNQIDMTLGLPADTLHQFFGIAHLPPNYVLKVPVRGTIEDPEFVTGPAIAKIAALVAAGQIPKKGVLGGIAELFSSPKEEKNVPPAKHPFPWER